MKCLSFLRFSLFVSLAGLWACNTQTGPEQISVPPPDLQVMLQKHRQSPLKTTGKGTDWAIDGVGFFSVLDTSHPQWDL